MKTLSLDLKNVPKDLARSLSGVAAIGDDLWLAGDEGVSIVRAVANKNGGYVADEPVSLMDRLDLVGHEDEEIDVEGMDVREEEDGLYLWLTGSHSLKRRNIEAPETSLIGEAREEHVADQIRRLAKVKAEGNRYLLARLPLERKGNSTRLLEASEYTEKRFAARLSASPWADDLIDEMRDDPLFERFLEAEIPGKDNGVDLEGLACIPGSSRLLLGLRGPVMRGWAVLIEVRVKAEFRDEKEPGRLRLKKIGAGGEARYLRHFLDLGGLGIRDICFEPNGDLLILAGPTMVLDYPPRLFRWVGARSALGDRETLVAQAPGVLELVSAPMAVPPPGFDRAEGLLLTKSGDAMIIYDNPTKARFNKGTLTADLLPLT